MLTYYTQNAAHCVFAQVTMLNSDVVSSVFRLGDEMTASEIKQQRVLGLGTPNYFSTCLVLLGREAESGTGGRHTMFVLEAAGRDTRRGGGVWRCDGAGIGSRGGGGERSSTVSYKLCVRVC